MGMHLRDGRFGLVEVKLGGEALVEEGASTLVTLANSVDVEKNAETVIQDGVDSRWRHGVYETDRRRRLSDFSA